ncbi:protein SPMIP2 [Ambystoma mexicanum]|uniref:protein SPMIP2 n=1 Tax=Ambystoma mexicanum TaxID=8296 RepID=UPI0037E77F86
MARERVSIVDALPPRLLAQSIPGQRILYTDPDGAGDYKTRQYDFTSYIGDKEPSRESTTDVRHLNRAAPGTFAPRYKHEYPREIGWSLQEHERHLNRDNLLSGMQIQLQEFRQASEDRVTHKYQTPWYPTQEEAHAQSARNSRRQEAGRRFSTRN